MLAVVVLAVGACTPESASGCDRLAARLDEASDALDRDGSAETLGAFHDAADAWRDAGCDRP